MFSHLSHISRNELILQYFIIIFIIDYYSATVIQQQSNYEAVSF